MKPPDDALGSSGTVNQLLEQWMTFQSSRGRSPTTLHGYRSLIKLHVTPTIGKIRLVELTAHHLDSLYAPRIAEGKSPQTIRNIHNVISASLNQAVKWGWLERNISERATLPTATARYIQAPSAEDVRRLIAACQKHDPALGAFVFLAAVTGCRRGEVAALRWSSIFDGTLLIRESVYSISGEEGLKSTKSGRERVVRISPEVVAWLQNWRLTCEATARDFGVSLGSDGFVVASRPDGSRFARLGSISHDVRKIAKSLDLVSLHLHSLRHFAASELIGSGISARDTADMLGHADPALTLRVYSHANAERQRAAADVLSAALAPRRK